MNDVTKVKEAKAVRIVKKKRSNGSYRWNVEVGPMTFGTLTKENAEILKIELEACAWIGDKKRMYW